MAAFVGDLEDPAGELELGPVGADGVQGLDEGLLGQVLGRLAVADHAVNQGEDRSAHTGGSIRGRRPPGRPWPVPLPPGR